MKLKAILESMHDNNLNGKFRSWFAGSKVKEFGKPLVVYHGTDREFRVFETPAFFTPDYWNADGYASGERVVEVLSLRNPYLFDAEDAKWDELRSELGTTTREIVATVQRTQRWDGVIFSNVKDAWWDDADLQDSDTVYVAFRPEQIKSVGNAGNWSSSPDIYL